MLNVQIQVQNHIFMVLVLSRTQDAVLTQTQSSFCFGLDMALKSLKKKAQKLLVEFYLFKMYTGVP